MKKQEMEMRCPLVTIIVPIYNSAQYLRKCIDGILSQSYENIQLILVDDGSSDDSSKICNCYSDKRIEYYFKTNGGASSARNEGLKHRKGEYVLFVDSDDSLVSKAIEILVSKALESGADCVFFEAENRAENHSISVKKNGLKQNCDYGAMDGDSLIFTLLDNKNYHASPVLYFMKSNLFDGGLSFEEGIMFEDELFTFFLLRSCNKVECLRQILYLRNVRPGSVMTSRDNELFRFMSITTVFEQLYYRFGENVNDKVYLAYIKRIAMLWLNYWESLSIKNRKNVSSDYERIKTQILSNDGFGSSELKIRCHSRILWYISIAPGRILKKIKGK